MWVMNKILPHQLHFVIMSASLLLCMQDIYKDGIIATTRKTIFITSVFSTTLIFCDLLYRLCYLLAELINTTLNHTERMKITTQEVFAYNIASIVIIIVSALTFFILISTVSISPFKFIWEFGPKACISSLVFTLFLLRSINFYQWNMEKSFVSSMKGLDYGTGMAYSYYYGYLRIVLPSTGTASKGLLEKIENFEDAHNVTVSAKKLFILIPSSLYIPPNLKDISNGWMESALTLEDEIRDNSGVLRRHYHNNVYKIYPGGRKNTAQPVYVAVEGATPMLTFLEVQRHAHAESSVYAKFSKDIIKTFSMKLQELLYNDPDCKDLSEVIYYDDYDNNGNKVNVAKILMDRISQILSTEREH